MRRVWWWRPLASEKKISVLETLGPRGSENGGNLCPKSEKLLLFFGTWQSTLKREPYKQFWSMNGGESTVRGRKEGRCPNGKYSPGGATCEIETQEVLTVFPGEACCRKETPLSLDELRVDYLRGSNLIENPMFCLTVLSWKLGCGRRNWKVLILEGLNFGFCVFL